MQQLETRLREALARVPLPDPTVRIERSRAGYLVVFVSRAFAALNEAERQRVVWESLLNDDMLLDGDVVTIEFIATVTPEEAAEMDLLSVAATSA